MYLKKSTGSNCWLFRKIIYLLNLNSRIKIELNVVFLTFDKNFYPTNHFAILPIKKLTKIAQIATVNSIKLIINQKFKENNF
ncbi:hypothetical protein CYCD_09530 [Tenuifilaceae bacterium CYCD]|nr:hypothetical protein CYCD_09530 [Tenuifilaceae bacterium CYCD]